MKYIPSWMQPHLGIANEIFVTLLVLAYAFGIDSHPLLSVPPFFERDISLSQAKVTESVSTAGLVGISFIFPLLLIGSLHTLYCWRTGMQWMRIGRSVVYVLLGLCQALLIAKAIYETMKLSFGRPRPNFYAYCNYAGYREALESGDFTAYNANTTVGNFGSVSKCTASTAEITSSLSAFPSGHAAMSFAGMLYLTMYFRSAVNLKGVHVTLGSLFTCWPLIVSSYIALSRFRDHFHFTDDVAVGSMIGIGSALVAWWHYQTSKRDPFELARNGDSSSALTDGAGASRIPPTPLTAMPTPLSVPSQIPYGPYGGGSRVVGRPQGVPGGPHPVHGMSAPMGMGSPSRRYSPGVMGMPSPGMKIPQGPPV